MGLPSLITYGIVAITAGLTAYALFFGPKGNTDSMGPQVEDFNPTMAKEGAVIPVIYGRVRRPANLVWYGDVRTKAIKQKTGGKGMGGGSSQTTGYKTYCSALQVVCLGTADIVSVYVNDTKEAEEPINADEIITSDGTSETPPPISEEYVNTLPGICWWYAKNWYIGDNTNTMPTLHFVVERNLSTPLPNPNLPNGSNPASVVYDIFRLAGKENTIDTESFIAASMDYADDEIGLNFAMDQQQDADDWIKKVLGYTNSVMYENNLGKWVLKRLSANYTHVIELSEKRMTGFSFNRKTWKQIPNYFKGTYINEDEDFTRRVVTWDNPAAIRLARNTIPQSIDLKAFRDTATANKMLYELGKQESYPTATIKFKHDLFASLLNPGEVMRISHAKYGIVSADFRLETIDEASIDKNEVAITARQVSETLFDDKFIAAAESYWNAPDKNPKVLVYTRIFELPYNSDTKDEPAFLVLAAREKFVETGFLVLLSNEETQGFDTAGNFTEYSQRGTLYSDYPASTFAIDDQAGIVYTAYNFDPVFDTITRAQLFNDRRVAIIGNEMIAFQSITPLGDNRYKLLGCIRGILGTQKEAHFAGDEIWLSYIDNNVLTKVKWGSFWTKIIPYTASRQLDASQVTAIKVETEYKARRPFPPGRLVATRSGSDISVQIFPRTPGYFGAGASPESVTDTAPPFPFSGDFRVEYNSTNGIVSLDSFSINVAGAVDIEVSSRLNGYTSAAKTVSVGAADGIYIA